MTNSGDAKSQEVPAPSLEQEMATCKTGRTRVVVGALIALVIVFLALAPDVWMPLFSSFVSSGAPERAAPSQGADAAMLAQKLDVLNARLERVEAGAPHAASEPGAQPQGQPVPPAAHEVVASEDLTRLKTIVESLSGALADLRGQLHQSNEAATHARGEARASVVALLALTRLDIAAASGAGFAGELAALRRALPSDPALTVTLDKLEVFAGQGAPTLPTLREEWRATVAKAGLAQRKAEAHGVVDRFLLGVQSLISIRSAQNAAGQGEVLDAVTTSLAAGRLGEALDKLKALPAPARAAVQEWAVRLAARQALDAELDALAARWAALGDGTSQGAPAAKAPLGEHGARPVTDLDAEGASDSIKVP